MGGKRQGRRVVGLPSELHVRLGGRTSSNETPSSRMILCTSAAPASSRPILESPALMLSASRSKLDDVSWTGVERAKRAVG